MICQHCGGHVEWKGPLSNLPHTECSKCGARNSQVPEIEEPDSWTECQDCGGEGLDTDSCECEAFEDICCCAEPKPSPCQTCNGKGGWEIDE